MTDKEIEKLLNIIDKKGLSHARKFLLKEKEKNTIKNISKLFDSYINAETQEKSNFKKNIIFQDTDKVIFSNGISFYFINNKFLNLDSKNFKNFDLQVKSNEYYKFVDKAFVKYLNCFFEEKETQLVDPMYIEERDFSSTSFIYVDDYRIEHSFLTDELIKMDKILNNPQYKMDIENPIIKAENEIGKAYILGLIRRTHDR